MIIRTMIPLLTLAFTKGSGELFDFHIISTSQSHVASESLCQSQGYDGLAVLNSPEKYNYALRITEDLRASSNEGVFVGLRNDSFTHLLTWDDGSLPAEDIPVSATADFTDEPYANIPRSNKRLKAAGHYHAKMALCGNHANFPTEAHGVSFPDLQPVGVSSILSMTSVISYLECVILCGQDYRCRAAEFNSDLLTCMVLGPDSYTGVSANSNSQIFVRNGYLLE